MIVYDKLFDLLKEKGISTYRIRKESIISQAALYKMKNVVKLTREGKPCHIDTRTIDRICEILDCQPADIMEYTPYR